MATMTFKCPSCGGGLEFDPTLQKYKCEYCLSEFSQVELEAMKPPSAKEGGGSAVLHTCPNCGAEIVTDETTAATFCFYCHNPVMLEGRLEGNYLPDYVLPFVIDKKKVTLMFTEWIQKKKYLPNAFFSAEQIEKLSGVYFPYLLYQCRIEGTLNAEGIKRRSWNSGNIQYTETQRYEVKRTGLMEVKNVPRNALKKADRKLVEGVLPFDMEKLKPFSMGYLSGFMAEKRDMEEQEFNEEVESEVKSFAAETLKSSAGTYDSLSVLDEKADICNPKWNYALMPVWTLTYKDESKDKIYYFALNGQTGKICGELPVDEKKLIILFLSVFLPIFLTLLIVGYMI